MKNKTIILLSSKRTGSSAFFKVFKMHPKVSCLLKENDVDMIELNFWNSAYKAINGDQSDLKKVLKKINFENSLPKHVNKKKIFFLWKKILKMNGGIVFDKSPSYLDKYENLSLINDFKKYGNDVIILGLIRDPRDAISSQHELWDKNLSNIELSRKIKKREHQWLNQYKNLEIFKKKLKFKIYRYEDICNKKNLIFKEIFKSCKLKYSSKYTNHIKPTSIGRYSFTFYKSLKRWKFSKSFKIHLLDYGYKNKVKVGFFDYVYNIPSYIKRFMPIKIYLFFTKIINFIKLFFGLRVKKWK